VKSSLISARQIAIAIIFGVAAAAVVIFHIEAPIGMDLLLNPAEIFVSLGAAFGGPIAGLIIGFLYGIGCYATNGFVSGVRNMPSHMLVAFVWGIWYIYIWRFTVNRNS